jgi:TP901 family phage tail tape measure protein
MAQQVVISFNANANFSDLIGEIKRANAEIGVLQNQLQGLGASSFGSLDILNKQFIEGMKNSRMWSSTFVDVTNETREFGRHLDQGRLKLKDYFREFNTQVKGQRGMIRKLAEEQVRLQRSVLTTTVGPQGQTRNVLSTPTGLDGLDPATMKALKSETFKIIGKSIQGVSTELINLGKNTQWAGRQLTVGLTVPLTMFAASAAMAFKEVDQQLTRLAKVYGDLGGATSGEIAAIRTQTTALAKSLAADLGAPIQDTIGLAADIAATGKTGDDLLKSVAETTRLAVLGEVSRQDAMSATLSLQNAFNLSTQELGESINFLNAVENQTSTSLDDLVTAIPKAGPVVKSLGGDVKDLALFLTAMKEGGINASEGANALKSGLASIINPTKQTTQVMNDFGIDIQGLVNKNAGDLVGTVQALQIALSKLDPLSKSKAIEQLFGKFQFARMSALFDNLGASGSQTLQVMDLMKASTVELANVADRELSILTESASGKFARQLESFKANMAGVGEGFLGVFSGVLGVLNKLLEGFNKLPDGVKNIMTILGVVVGLAGPLIMLSGVFLNFFGYLTKAAGFMGRLFTGTKGFELLNERIMANKLSTDNMSNSFYDQAKATEVARMEIDKLIASMQNLMAVQETASSGAAMGGEGMRFNTRGGTRSGDLTTGAEFSHLQLSKDLTDKHGKDIASLLMTQGTYLPQTREYAQGATFQRQMSSNMPGLITNGEDRSAAMRPYAEKAGKMPEFGQMSAKELEALMPSLDTYLETQSQQLATWKTFQGLSKDKADALRKEVLKAMSSGDAEGAIMAIKQSAAAQGIAFDDEARAYSEIGRAAYNSGSDLESRSKALLVKFEELEVGLLKSDSEMSKWLLTKGGNVNKMALNLANLSSIALTQLESTIQKADANFKSQLSGMSSTVDTKTKRLGVVTIKFIDGVAQVFDSAGNMLAADDAAKNPKVRAEIAKLQMAKEKLELETQREIQEAYQAANAASMTMQADNGVPPAAAAAGGRFSRVKGAFSKQGIKGMMKPGMGSSMAMMGLGMGASMMPTGGSGALNTAGNIAGGAMMGASMGMMFGPIGTAVGAALGAIVPAATALWKALDKLRDIASLTARQYEIDKEYAKAAGINLKTIGDIQLTQLTGKSAEAASALDILSKAALEASTNTTTGALREKTKGADNFDVVKKDFESQYLSYLAAGVPEETARVMMAAILKAAGKEEFSTDLNMTLNKYKNQSSSDATATSLKRAAEGTVAGTNYQGVADRAESFGLTERRTRALAAYTDEQLKGFNYTQEQIQYVRELESAYAELDQKQQQIADNNIIYGTTVQTAQAVDILSNAIANQDMSTFADSMSKASAAGNITKDVVDGVQASIKGLSKSENTVLDGLQRNGVESADVMLALKMRVEGVITSLEEVNGFDGMKIRATFELYQANQQLDKAKADLKSSLEGMFAGGSSAPNNEAAKKAIQAQLDALDEIARKEGNINKIKELQLKYEEKRRNLALDYLGALSSGDMEGALRAQLEMQAESARFLEEKAKTEKEIARDDQKKALQDKLKNLDSASGAVKNTANKAKELQTNIENAITSMMEGFKKNGKIGMTMDEFVKSPEYANFESKFKGMLSPDAIIKAMDTLKGTFSSVKAELAALAAGVNAPAGTSKNPKDITDLGTIADVLIAEGKGGVASALGGDQKKAIIAAAAGRGEPFVDNEYVTIFGEKYRYDAKKNDLIRSKNAQGLWMGGSVKGYAGGGYMGGIGTATSDSNYIRASKGEFMQSARAVNYYGVANMERLNRRQIDPRVFEPMREAGSRNDNGVNVNIASINITEPGCTADEIIAKIEKKLGAAVKRTTDNRVMRV